MKNFILSIITPEKILFSGEADMVTAPGTEGEFGVLPGHMPFVSTLKPGIVTVQSEAAETVRLAVAEGIAEVTPERCIILTEMAELLDQASAAKAQGDLRAAEEALAVATTEENERHARRRKALAEVMLASG